MAERLTVARPYAEAVFALAQEEKTLAPWAERLALMRMVNGNTLMRAFLDGPHVDARDKIAAFVSICGNQLGGEGERLLDVLVRGKRLELLPEIETLFNQLKDNAENTVHALIETALPIDDAQVAMLKTLLSQKTGKDIDAEVSVNPDLIGGTCIRVGDQVIDASIKGRLMEMARALQA
jgi:ATP synthase, F1 delta subunit